LEIKIQKQIGELSMTETMAAILPNAARRFAERTAMIVEDRSFTFRELDQLSNRIANGLLDKGVQPGDRVTLYGHNCWEWIVAYYGIVKTGAVVNPINVMLTPEEVRFVVEDSGARAVVASGDKGASLLDMGGRCEIVLWGDKSTTGASSFNEWLEQGSSAFKAVIRSPADLGAICYTSGTTGFPKGAMQSHRSVISAIIGTTLMAARNMNDRVVSALPCPHVYGSCVFNGAIMSGATFIMVPRFEEVAMLRAVAEHKATIMDGVPTVYYYLLAHPDFDKFDLSSLTRCWTGGQTLPAAKSIEFTERVGCPVHEVWGMTELAGPASANPAVGPSKPGTIGIAYPGNQMQVVDINDPERVLAPGERGELMFRGPMVMDGYYGNEAATRATIEPTGWLHSGDIATVDEDGYFSIVDRMKDMILTAGFNIYPAELERVLCMHPAVALAAVGSVPDEAKGELAKAYVILRQGASITQEALTDHCRQHLAAYKVPRAIQFVADVPKTSTGKIMRRSLSKIDDGSRRNAGG
jgi:long-chain acyl-CoA synthetase